MAKTQTILLFIQDTQIQITFNHPNHPLVAKIPTTISYRSPGRPPAENIAILKGVHLTKWNMDHENCPLTFFKALLNIIVGKGAISNIKYYQLQVNLDMTDSMGQGKLVRHMQNPSYTYDEYLICIGLGPSILSVICKNLLYSGPSYPSSPALLLVVKVRIFQGYTGIYGLTNPSGCTYVYRVQAVEGTADGLGWLT